ncbi:MAG: imidazole glycerol phosphate synthase subunit HisF [Hyphomicrobiales bacterium]
MLCKRLITVLTFSDGVLFRTKKFRPDYRYTLKFVDSWSVDEIVVLDVTRDPADDRRVFKTVVGEFARRCFVPLAAGGGIRTLEDVHAYLDIGADKVVLNTGALRDETLITKAANAFGTQCVVISIDCAQTRDGYEVRSDFGGRPTGRSPLDWARRAEDLGAGEIMLNSIERDGSLLGYELDLCRQIAEAVNIPVLICGGAGNWKHFEDGFKIGKADAVCTTNIYHFTETSIQSAKSYLAAAGVRVRP